MGKNNYSIPFAIVFAGIIIAGAIFYNSSQNTPNSLSGVKKEQALDQAEKNIDNIRPITSDDHIRGNPNAPIKIVEYSDLECPFCKDFHPTMQQVMEEYGKDGKVAWIYRQFPLDSIHPIKARTEAIASECVNEIGGNGSFWRFVDRFFELTPSNNKTDIDTVIPKIIGEIGIDKTLFGECLNSGRYDEHIQDDIDNAILTGGQGTPWSIILTSNGKKFPLAGAQPYASVKQLIDIALKEQ